MFCGKSGNSFYVLFFFFGTLENGRAMGVFFVKQCL